MPHEIVYEICQYLSVDDIGHFALCSKTYMKAIWSMFVASRPGRDLLIQKAIHETIDREGYVERKGYGFADLKKDLKEADNAVAQRMNESGKVQNLCVPIYLDVIFHSMHIECAKLFKRLTILHPIQDRIELFVTFLKAINGTEYQIDVDSLYSSETTVQVRALMRAQGKALQTFIAGWKE